MVQIPGKDANLRWNTAGPGISSTTMPFPTASQIRTYPTSYEASNASNVIAHNYAWVPTDSIDNTFM